MILYPDGHPSESTTYMGLALTLQGKTAYTGPTPMDIPCGAPESWGFVHSDCSEPTIHVFTLTATRVSQQPIWVLP